VKEELRESHSGRTEEGMIRASLCGLKGSASEQANVKALLLLFALVPEDTHCPLEVLLLMLQTTPRQTYQAWWWWMLGVSSYLVDLLLLDTCIGEQ
jgi:hypothetical protein